MNDHWELLDERQVFAIKGRLSVSLQHIRTPKGVEVKDYLQFSSPHYVTILAQTEAGPFICERHYKHGPRRIVLSLPAGMIETNEDPVKAAQRELLEETGYVSDHWRFLCSSVLHANAGGAWAHAFLAERCRKVAEPNSGDLEEMTIELVTPQQILDALRAGEMPLIGDPPALLAGMLELGLLTPK